MTTEQIKDKYNGLQIGATAVSSHGTMVSRMHFDAMMAECDDAEMKKVFASYKAERDNIDTK